MNLWDHLGELRQRLLWCVIAFALCMVPTFWLVNPIIQWMAEPIGELVFLTPMEAFNAQLEVALSLGFVLALPVFLYQAWAFAATGLTGSERGYLRLAVPVSYVCFMAGAVFSSFWMMPKAVGFLLHFQSSSLVPMISVKAYLDLFVASALVCGLLFQLPLALHFLAKTGILTAQAITGHRRVIYLIIFIASSVLNPGTDIISMLAMAFLCLALFEISVWLVHWETRREP